MDRWSWIWTSIDFESIGRRRWRKFADAVRSCMSGDTARREPRNKMNCESIDDQVRRTRCVFFFLLERWKAEMMTKTTEWKEVSWTEKWVGKTERIIKKKLYHLTRPRGEMSIKASERWIVIFITLRKHFPFHPLSTPYTKQSLHSSSCKRVNSRAVI